MSIEEDLKNRDLWADGFQTRDGRPVRILCVDRNQHQFPVLALYRSEVNSMEEILAAYSDGMSCWSSLDLIRRPVKHKRWVNFYGNGATTYLTKPEAHRRAAAGRIACVEIEFTEGQGL